MTIRRGRLTAFIDRHLTAWELVMALLAVAYLFLSFLADSDRGIEAAPVIGLAVVFVVEFTTRCMDAPSRLHYVRQHWLDLVSSVPLVGGLRSLRLLRLVRLGAGGRVIRLAGGHAERAHGGRQSFWFVGPLLVVAWFAAAAAYYTLEHGVNPHAKTFGDALYWAFITATTVGYGDYTPITEGGRILAGVLVFGGIGLIGFSSARLTQRLLRDESLHHPRLAVEKLTRLEAEIETIKQLLLAQRGSRDPEPIAGATPDVGPDGGRGPAGSGCVEAEETEQAVGLFSTGTVED